MPARNAHPGGVASRPADLPARIVVVPTRGAAATLARTLTARGIPEQGVPALLTRDEIYDALHARLSSPRRRLSAFDRDAMAQAAAVEAAREAGDLPFTVRPGLVAEILRFYDQLRRQSQLVRRFEELITDALGGGDLDDRGADRLLRQTRFLAQTFRGYEQRADESDAVDEHRLRERLIADGDAFPLDHVVITVPDWIADPAGLFVADFDLLSRLPNLVALDIVSTEAVLASGFHERLHNWWPGIEEVHSVDLGEPAPRVRPMLVVPEPTADLSPLWFTHRDREEELIAIARRLSDQPAMALDRAAVVFKRPLPYLYLAADTLGALGIPFVVCDALPLAAEPSVTAVDLVLDALEADFARDTVVALLRSPHLDASLRLERASIAALDRALSEARYLGGAERLFALAESWGERRGAPERRGVALRRAARPAMDLAVGLVRELIAIQEERTASGQLAAMLAFLETHFVPLDEAHPLFERERRARGAVLRILRMMASAHAAHHDPAWKLADLATSVRRWIGDETFLPDSADAGVRLLDDQAARYGEFDDVTVVGLIETEWPDRPRRNIFYPPNLLKALSWPSEKDRRGAADARFLDLLASATARVELSAFLLDDEAIVSRSILLDEVARARLSTIARPEAIEPLLRDERLALEGKADGDAGAETQSWLGLRAGRTPADDPAFHGAAGPGAPASWSVSALETYIGCPFRFFAQHMLRLEEEPDDEEVMDPRRQGQFVHEVFETFFREWQDAGHREITPVSLPLARALFTTVVDRALERVPEGEAALERTRLLGSPAAAGLGEAVFRMEAERPVPVVARLLEHKLEGPVTIQTDAGPRTVTLRGKADRLDLLSDGTFRLIDYKLGWPPDKGKALQLPIYALCAEQQLDVLGRTWTVGEAVYLAFKGPKRVVPLFSSESSRADTLARAQQRLADTLDAIARGEFPPSPDDVYRCDTCGFPAVCRKDYVGDL
jgi:RecB family exonuclease